MQHLETCLLIAEADRVLCHLAMVYCLLFFRCRSFSLWWPLTFPLFLTVVIYKIIMFFCKRNWSACFFTFRFRSRSFSVIHVNVDIKFKWKQRISFDVVVFISKSPLRYVIYRENALGLEMQNLIPAYMRG